MRPRNRDLARSAGLAFVVLLTSGLPSEAATPVAEFEIRAISRADPGLPSSTGAFASFPGLRGYSISDDGRFVAFSAYSPNIIPDFTIVSADVFVLDRTDDQVIPVSTSIDDSNRGGNLHSGLPAISGDGSKVLFISRATDLIPDYEGTPFQLYSRALATGQTALVSHAWDSPTRGANDVSEPIAISHDGRYAYVLSYATDLVEGYLGEGGQIYLADLESGEITLVTHAWISPTMGTTGAIWHSATSADGRLLAFTAFGANLVPGDSGDQYQVYLFDRSVGEVSLLSHSYNSPAQFSNGSASELAVSASGNTVAYRSTATDLVAGAQVSGSQIYVRNLGSAATLLASSSVSDPSIGGNGNSSLPSLSGDGRFLTFSTLADDLLPYPVPSNGGQILLLDLAESSRTLITHTPAGPTSPSSWGVGDASISRDGSYVVLTTTAIDLVDPPFPELPLQRVYSFERTTGDVQLLTNNSGLANWSGPDQTYHYSVSGTGGAALIESNSGDLIDGDWNQGNDVFVAELDSGMVAAASRRGPGLPSSRTANGRSRLEAPGVTSDDGRYAVFWSYAANLSPDSPAAEEAPAWYFYDSESDGIRRMGRGLPAALVPDQAQPAGSASAVLGLDSQDTRSLSAAGSVAVFTARPGIFENPQAYAYFRDDDADRLVSHSMSSPSTPSNGPAFALAVSANGRFVVFQSEATDLVSDYEGSDYQIYLYDLLADSARLVTRRHSSPSAGASGRSSFLGVSFDGRWLAFRSDAPDLLPSPSGAARQVYLYDAAEGSVQLVSHTHGNPLNGSSLGVDFIGGSMSQDGRFVLFTSSSADLIGGNGSFEFNQVFVWDRLLSTHRLASHAVGSSSSGANNWVWSPRLSRDGRAAIFLSEATNLIAGYVGSEIQVYRFDRSSSEIRLVSRSTEGSNHGSEAGAWEPSISADGSRIALVSLSRDLSPASPTRGAHLYVYEVSSDTFSVLTAPPASQQAPFSDFDAEISSDGRTVAFACQIGYLTERDWNQEMGAWDVFLATETPPGLIFLDGFSSGDTSRWSVAAP